MKFFDLLRAGLSALWAHKFRSALTLLGVTLGALLLFCSLSGGMGVTKAVNERLAAGDRLREILVTAGVQTDEVTVEKAIAAGFDEAMPDDRRIRLATASGVGGIRRIPMNLAAGETLRQISGVQTVWSTLRFNALAHFESGDRWKAALGSGVPPKPLDLSSLRIAGKGNGPQSRPGHPAGVWVSELFLYQNGIRTSEEIAGVLGTSIELTSRNNPLERAAQSLSDEQRRIAEKSLTYRSPRFTIDGVFRFPDRTELHDNPDWSFAIGTAVLMPYDDAKACWNGLGMADSNTAATVLVESADAVPLIEKLIAQQGYATRSLSEIASQIQTAVLLISLIVTSIAGGALLISAIGITNTMVMNVLERRKDIAVMKAIGARDRDLRRMFLIEGCLMGLAGGLSGLVLGLVFSQLCGQWIRRQLEERLNEPLGESVFAFPWWLIVGTPLVAAIVTMLASYVPASRAAKIDPAQTLRGL